MNGATQDTLLSTCISVFEKHAFIFADPVEPKELKAPEHSLLAWVSFHGGARGDLLLAIQPELANEISANLVGDDPVAGLKPLLLDAIGELANVLCGNLLKATLPDKIFDLDPPVVFETSAFHWNLLALCPTTIALQADEHSALIQMRWNNSPR